MNKFDEYKIKISPKNKILVDGYLENIKNFILENNLEKELYSDIEERVFEKLSIHKTLSELKIKQSLNEIGNPEDIFELEEGGKNFDFINSLKKLKNKGVKSIVKIFESGFNFKNLFVFIKTIFLNLVSFIKTIFLKLLSLIKKMILKIFDLIKYAFSLSGTLFKKLWKLTLMFFNFIGSFIGYIILFSAISLLFIVPIIHNGLDIGNINYISIIPKDLVISYYLLALFIGIIGLYLIIKKYLLIHFIIASVSLFLLIGFGFTGGSKLYNNHGYEGKIIQNLSVETSSGVLKIKERNINIYPKSYIFHDIIDIDLAIKPSIDNLIHIEVISTVHTGNENKLDEIRGQLNGFEVQIIDDRLFFGVKNNEMFIEKHEFVPIERNIIIYLPEKQIVEFGYFEYNDIKGKKLRECLRKNDYNPDFNMGNINGEIVCLEETEEEKN